VNKKNILNICIPPPPPWGGCFKLFTLKNSGDPWQEGVRILTGIHMIPRGPTRLKSRTLDSEIIWNQTRNQEITREISQFWNQKSLKLRYYWAHSLIWQR
jgi:hypothetical protein